MSTGRIARALELARVWAVATAMIAIASPALGQALESKLVIVTSFPKDLYSVYATAFEKKHPGTKVEVLNKGTSAGIAYVRETAAKPPDLFWASAPDAFEVLKGQKLLQKYQTKAQGIPEKVGAYPINDPGGFYLGFAASGYGIMYNTRYIQAKKLPVAKEWDDLKKPIYQGHVAISAPSRSGTTHLTIETILQGEGWEKGWATNLELAGNYAAVTERSFGVPEGVNNGQYGFGIVIDFFGLSAKGSGFPVEFVYPTLTTLVPANIGMIAGAQNPNAAAAFIEFVLSPEGQDLLFTPAIRRLPVLPTAYSKAPDGYPNPFKDSSIGKAVKFDSDVSEQRYELVNSLYDQIITFRLAELTAAWKAIHAAEAALARKPNAEAAKLVADARRHATAVPVTAAQAADRALTGQFAEKVKDKPVGKRQAELEEEWAQSSRKSYAEAKSLADRAAGLAK